MSIAEPLASLTLQVSVEKWPLQAPFRITGYTFVAVDVVVATISCRGRQGRGEAAGVYYRGETAESMTTQIEAVRADIEAGIDREALQRLLPAGGARNAIDCALWDLEAHLSGIPAWKLAGLNPPVPLVTTFTLGADDPDKMAQAATSYVGAQAIKLKLTGTPIDAERVRAVRAARPEAWLAVDANQGFTRASLADLMPTLVDARVGLIEQPFPIGREADLDGLRSPIPIAADESVQDLKDVPGMVGRFNVVNIKLDKCGGLTEGLAMARQARALGLDVMVGNMTGTALAMAPGMLVGQLCRIVDLDGPIFLRNDRPPGVVYESGTAWVPPEVWGGGARAK
ncbi:MAG TPA: dipeptide epimerase [Steroidobacteraceae bacterium]|jgi:L-alanine-DL-glutamate epimerase-like enolase superfamily enzyme